MAKRKALLLFGIFLTLMGIISCTTIELAEQDAFDNHRIIIPEMYSSETYTLDTHTVTTPDDETLAVWHFKRDDAQATVFYFGGNGFLLVKSVNWLDGYAEIPVNLVFFDYRGYGLSSGTPGVQGITTDAISVMSFIGAKEEARSLPFILHGHSMGSIVASTMAKEFPDAAALILESPVTNAPDLTRGLIPWLLRPFIRFRFDDALLSQDNVQNIAEISAPTLFITGKDDMITPKRMAEKLHRESPAANKELRLIEGGGHNDLPEFSAYRRALGQFINNTLN
ncbi:MAG: alpha/beta hydrolase [Balneolales bacterium]|nr:alpha/beta hydrolase [Balneolales bacterium]